MLRVFRYRLSPTPGQARAMHATLGMLRELYNAALQERIAAHRAGIKLSCYGQQAELREVRAVRPEFAAVHVHLLQDAITRLDRAYRAFFRRLKAGERAGFPRFKGRGRYRTFTFKDAANRNGVAIVSGGKRVRLTGIGNIKLRLHRPIQGRIKQASVSLSGDGHWYVAFACDDVPAKPLPSTDSSVGIDVGITTFAALSNGEMVPNPRWYETGQRELAMAQRRISRRRRGSRRRRKAVALLAKRHDRIRRVRLDFHITRSRSTSWSASTRLRSRNSTSRASREADSPNKFWMPRGLNSQRSSKPRPKAPGGSSSQWIRVGHLRSAAAAEPRFGRTLVCAFTIAPTVGWSRTATSTQPSIFVNAGTPRSGREEHWLCSKIREATPSRFERWERR